MIFQTKKMIKTNKTQLSTNHWSLTNQTHSDSEVRENGFAKKSQEMKVKTKMTRITLKSKDSSYMQTKTRKKSINDPKDSYEAIKLIWVVKNAKTQIQKFEQKSSQAGNMTQCENH
jgi:hypothetical protein